MEPECPPCHLRCFGQPGSRCPYEAHEPVTPIFNLTLLLTDFWIGSEWHTISDKHSSTFTGISQSFGQRRSSYALQHLSAKSHVRALDDD